MKIEELEKEHYKWVGKIIASEKVAEKHTKLSIQFAIEMLEEVVKSMNCDSDYSWWYEAKVENKIEELKKHLK